MSMWNPDPPQGFSTVQGQVIIGRSPIPLFEAPQGLDDGIPPPLTVPTAPVNLTALAISSTEIDLDWMAPAFDGGTPVTGYQIEREKEAEGFIIIVADTGNTNTFFNDSGLEVNTLYSYRVAAINAIGTGPVSNIDSDTTFTVPDAPTSLVALAISQTEIDIDWVAPVFVGGTPITGYQIEREREAEGFIIIVADTGNTNVFFNDTGLDPNILYSYRVAAINSVGVGAVSNIDSATTFAIVGGSMQYEDLTTMEYELNWLDPLFLKRIPLTINAAQVPSTQIDFPLLINDTFTDLIGEVEAELRFASIANIQLEYEIEKFDNVTGELIAWVKKPTVSDGDIIFIYFDNPAAVDEQNPGAVWSDNFTGVYHLNGVGIDSSPNGLDLTKNGTTTVPAQIGDGTDFNGTVNDFYIRNPFNGFPTTEFSCQFWIETIDTTFGMLTYAVSSQFSEFATFFVGGNLIINIGGPGVSTGGTGINDGNLHLVSVSWRSSDGQLDMYIDGINVLNTILQQGFSFTDGGAVVLAQEQDSVGGGFVAAQALDGILDETRISSVFRSADYVTTTFNNQSNPSAFYSTGAVELVPISIEMEYES